MTTRTKINEVIRGETELAWGDNDDDILLRDSLTDDILMVDYDGSTIWEKKT